MIDIYYPLLIDTNYAETSHAKALWKCTNRSPMRYIYQRDMSFNDLSQQMTNGIMIKKLTDQINRVINHIPIVISNKSTGNMYFNQTEH